MTLTSLPSLAGQKKTNMADPENVSLVFLAISNIPAVFRSADLRNYFSQFIESGGFHCFHYRHRPELHREQGDGEAATSGASEPDTGCGSKQAAKSCCCVVSVPEDQADRLIKMYSGNHWINSKGNWLSRRCVIKRVKVSDDKGW